MTKTKLKIVQTADGRIGFPEVVTYWCDGEDLIVPPTATTHPHPDKPGSSKGYFRNIKDVETYYELLATGRLAASYPPHNLEDNRNTS